MLGPIVLSKADGTELRSLLAQPKRTALLAYLAAEAPRGFQRRDTLLGIFWPEFDETRARAALSRALHFLRGGLGTSAIASRGDDELTVDPAHVWCDVVAFDAARAAGDHAGALALYRGDLLEGFLPDEVPEFERWLERERRRLRQAAAHSAAAVAESREAEGDVAGAVAAARRRVELDVHDETALRALIGLLHRTGDRAGALAAYETAARQLRDELGVEPSTETRAFIEAIRAGRASSAVPSAARGGTPVGRPGAAPLGPTAGPSIDAPSTRSPSAPSIDAPRGAPSTAPLAAQSSSAPSAPRAKRQAASSPRRYRRPRGSRRRARRHPSTRRSPAARPPRRPAAAGSSSRDWRSSARCSSPPPRGGRAVGSEPLRPPRQCARSPCSRSGASAAIRPAPTSATA